MHHRTCRVRRALQLLPAPRAACRTRPAAFAWPLNSPSTVGPDPLTSDSSAPASSGLRTPPIVGAATTRPQPPPGRLWSNRAPTAAALPASARARPVAASRHSSSSPPSLREPLLVGLAMASRRRAPQRRPPATRAPCKGSAAPPAAPLLPSPASAPARSVPARPQERRRRSSSSDSSPSPDACRQAQRCSGIRRAASQPGRHRDALDDAQPQRRRIPARRSRGSAASARAARFLPWRPRDPRADQLVALRTRPTPAARNVSSSASEIDCITVTSSWRPSALGCGSHRGTARG